MPLLLLSMVEAKSNNNLSDKELHAVMSIITNYILTSDTTTSVSKSTLKKTGQTISYYPGDDGTYQKGVTPSYTRSNDVVKDHITGLQWQDDVEAKTVMKTWSEAQNYCSDLGLDGGGWRLPTIQELQSIVVDVAYDLFADLQYDVSWHDAKYQLLDAEMRWRLGLLEAILSVTLFFFLLQSYLLWHWQTDYNDNIVARKPGK